MRFFDISLDWFIRIVWFLELKSFLLIPTHCKFWKFFISFLYPLIPLNPLKKAKKWGFLVFFRMVHRNCLIFATKVNLGNTYTLQVLKFFDQFLIPSKPLNPLKKAKKWGFFDFSSNWFRGIVWFLVSRPTGCWDLRSCVCFLGEKMTEKIFSGKNFFPYFCLKT